MTTHNEPRIDHKKLALRNAVRSILQAEIAGEVWYQDRSCEMRLIKCLENAEEKFVEYLLNFIPLAAVKEAVGERELHKHDSIPTYDSYAAEGCITCVENKKISDLLYSLGISDKDHENH